MVVPVPLAGGVALVVTAYSYPVAPVTAVQFIVAPFSPIPVMVGVVVAGHSVVKLYVVHEENVDAPHLFLTCR